MITMGKTLIILGSARKDSHTRTLLRNVFSGIEVEVIDLLDHYVAPFDYDAKYPEKDEFDSLMEKVLVAENIVFATPVYWYSMSGILKTFIDRFTDLVTIQKEKGRALKGKDMFLFSVGADAEPPEGFEVPFRKTASYLGMKYHEGVYISSRSESFGGVQLAVDVFQKALN